MTEITDHTAGIGEAWERGVAGPLAEFLTVFARGIAARPDVYSDDLVNSARAVLATVEAPAPTLAEELRCLTRRLERTTDPDRLLDLAADFFSVADYAEQMEHDLAEARAEVERLTAVNEELRRTDNYKEFKEFLGVQKGAESNAETPDPADVKPGEAWMVECDGEIRPAVKDAEDIWCWCTVNNDGNFRSESNLKITLVSRLVPAPRVITDPDDLDALATRTVILSTDGQADVYQKDGNGEWLDVSSHGYSSQQVIRMENAVTVLW